MEAKKIKCLNLYSGIGGNRKFWENVDVTAIEHDPEIARMYQKFFPEDKVIVTDAHQYLLEHYDEFDFIWSSPPCFLRGTLITTNRGTIPIEEIKIGDSVLTHKNRFKKVIHTMMSASNHYYNLKVAGSPLTQVTEEHPFYCKKHLDGRGNKKLLTSEWVAVKNLQKDDLIAFGVWYKGRKNIKKLDDITIWLLGRYVADGWIRDKKYSDGKQRSEVIFAIGKEKIKYFKEKTKNYKLHIGKYENRTSYKCYIYNKEMMKLCEECGVGASNKKIPQWIMNLPKQKLEIFLEGYMSGDGSKLTTKRYNDDMYATSSISKILIFQVGQIINLLYKSHYTMTTQHRTKPHYIEGRLVNCKREWMIRFQKEKSKFTHYKYDGKNIYGRFLSKEKINLLVNVYNLEVEEDNSYVANNMIVHNCPTHSMLRKGLSMNCSSKAVFPDMRLYEEILFLMGYFKGKWVVENVHSWYDPLIKPYELARHYFWSNFVLPKKEVTNGAISITGGINSETAEEQIDRLSDDFGFDVSDYKGDSRDTRTILRNCVNPELGKHIFDFAFKHKQLTIDDLNLTKQNNDSVKTV